MKILWDRRNVLPLQQHAYPASRKNSALRVSLLFSSGIFEFSDGFIYFSRI